MLERNSVKVCSAISMNFTNKNKTISPRWYNKHAESEMKEKIGKWMRNLTRLIGYQFLSNENTQESTG